MDAPNPPPLLSLPPELIQQILTFVSLSDLLSISLVNRVLYEHSLQDTLYKPLVQSPTQGITPAKPDELTWRELYKTHHPYWFIPRNKIWFADNVHTGKLLIARYNHRLNAIEAFALVAERRQPTFPIWDWHPEVIIHTFDPKLQLDLNAPILRLDCKAYENAVGDVVYRLQKEVPMNVHQDHPESPAGHHSRLILTSPLPPHKTSSSTSVWPPLILPSENRTRTNSATHFRDISDRPSTLSELSPSTFRIRKWLQFSSRRLGHNQHIGEEIITFATLPEELYTPTPQKPWQGIWCGDYAGHGVEFLVVTQPEEPDSLPLRADWAMLERERQSSVSSVDSWSTAHTSHSSGEAGHQNDAGHVSVTDPNIETSWGTAQPHEYPREHASSSAATTSCNEDDSIYRGRIEAIKLTGDPNIPRGEYTFIAPDIGANGLVRIATEDMFKGARIVKSVGHIAARGYRDDDFIPSQLILISHDRLAQYWEEFGHVSFYQRVNIDEFTKVD
ncbi:uncharacterized protein BDR25DRAFT_209946 [Lindgomyces ingoldianus]|uniref:Uncharacterized protein n=1 Tax=Lindgomyces ingoldianus TaxID=673940 RepID=A0ACB6RD52_9PLEO|nr:uncharacterized protein BDR25DRAFT_209946 [Lindgomyces ingoldianus]KAF2476678.1 hypothetical protein BDR25DRAFT_209946 [Lindgomyces ingoldianus]